MRAKKAAAARKEADSEQSPGSARRKEKGPTGGARAAATEGGRERGLADWAGLAWIGPREVSWAAGTKRKRRGEAGLGRWWKKKREEKLGRAGKGERGKMGVGWAERR